MMKIPGKTGWKRERAVRAGASAVRPGRVEREVREPVVLAPRLKTRVKVQEGCQAYLWSTARGRPRRSAH